MDDLDVAYKYNVYITNYCKKEVVYGELNDNILIVGLSLACRIYIYDQLINYVGADLPENPLKNVKLEDIHNKYWDLYKEAQQKYYMFFDHYAWHCKLFSIENLTKEGLEDEVKWLKTFTEKINKLPSIDENYSKYKRFNWSTWKGIPNYPEFRHSSSILGLTLAQYDWPGMKEFMNQKEVPIKWCKPQDIYWIDR